METRRGARRDRAPPRRAARGGGRGRRPLAAGARSSSTTAARRARAGGGTSAGCEMTDEELVDDGEALGCLEQDGAEPSTCRRIARSRSSGRSRFPPQQHQFDDGRRRRRPARGRHGLDRHRRSTTPPARSRCGAGKTLRDERAADRARPRRPVSTRRRSRRRFAGSPRSLLAGDGRYPHLERLLRREPAARRRVACSARELDEQRALARPARGLVPRRPGPARVGQDLPRRAADHAPARRREARSGSPRRATR